MGAVCGGGGGVLAFWGWKFLFSPALKFRLCSEQEQGCYLCIHCIYADSAHICMLGCAAACENVKFNSRGRALAWGSCSSSSASFNYCCCCEWSVLSPCLTSGVQWMKPGAIRKWELLCGTRGRDRNLMRPQSFLHCIIGAWAWWDQWRVGDVCRHGRGLGMWLLGFNPLRLLQ